MKRRDFLKMAGTAGAGLAAGALAQQHNRQYPFDRPPATGKSAYHLTNKPMETVRVAFIGVGARGGGHVGHFVSMEGTEIVAICDIHEPTAERAAKRCTDGGRKKPALYTNGVEDYKRMLDRDDIDIVIISTPWEWHVPMSVDTMNAGKHAFVEVPAALTIEGCWELVDTSERTQKHCMMMENVNYGREELMVLNMCRQGLFGELVHGEASYIHDLRGQMNQIERGTGSWRTLHYTTTNGNLYPTHGLGPVAQYMNINRGDRLDYMSSISSKSRVREIYAAENYPEGHPRRELDFVCGDINTTIARTVNGKSLMIQWDEQSPRPYTRHNLIQGTKGTFAGFPDRLVVEGESPSTHSWEQGGDLTKWYEKYDHPLFRAQGELAQKMGGHGGMDFLMLWRIVYCLRNGEPLDQDVYDAAVWSAITPLSVWSVANRGQSIDVPDFTRGKWRVMEPLAIFDPEA